MPLHGIWLQRSGGYYVSKETKVIKAVTVHHSRNFEVWVAEVHIMIRGLRNPSAILGSSNLFL